MEDDGENIDLRMVCRTCLASSNSEFQTLDTCIANGVTGNELNGKAKSTKKLTFWDCLYYCTHLDDIPDFPIYICHDCCNELKVAYNFIRNAFKANKILKQNLLNDNNINNNNNDLMVKNNRHNDSSEQCLSFTDGSSTIAASREQCRFRCKICNEKVESKKLLKEHIKLHLDVISYNCQMCSFATKKRSKLSLHYNANHNVEPTTDMLRANTQSGVQTKRYSTGSEATTSSFAKQYTEYIAKTENVDGDNAYIAPDFDDSTIAMSPSELLAQQQLAEIEQQLALSAANTEQQEDYTNLQQQQQMHTPNDMPHIQLDATIITTSDGQQIATITTEQLQELQNAVAGGNTVGNELSVGNEFIVMADGSVEEVMGNNVVIEYINAGNAEQNTITLDNGMVLNNLVQVPESLNKAAEASHVMNIDVQDYIVDPGNSFGSENVIAAVGSEALTQAKKKIKCKICSALFNTQDRLKTHMLTHNEIPHFFCDQCTFYTFFKVDLTQHYRTKHKLQPTLKQLQPKNKMKNRIEVNTKNIYTCDLCLFETHIRANLRRHYQFKHQVQATEVQLRPALADNENDLIYGTPDNRRDTPDYPGGFNCKKCNQIFYWRNQFKEHYKEHLIAEKRAARAKNAMYTTVHLGSNETNQSALPSSSSSSTSISETAAAVATLTALTTNSPAVIAEPIYSSINTTAITTSAVTTQAQTVNHSLNMPKAIHYPTVTETVPVANSSPNKNDLHAIAPSLPIDAIPQIVETDSTTVMINNNMDFDFNGDANLFEDFEDDNNDEEEQDDEGVQNLVLTSDDDLDDLLNVSNEQIDVVGSNYSQPYCTQCSKKFFSHYQFENHMFVHRGLAPYRCEMCTNLYNTKRALIRHYKAVHKTIPTRDMIQAKGDKVAAANVPVEHLNLDERKAQIMMCSNCPFESTELQNIKIHLRTTHGITDENHILHKLPFECPRCIRCFPTKSRLIRHLERSHSVATIIQRQNVPDGAVGKTAESISTPSNINFNNNNINITTPASATAASLHNLPNIAETDNSDLTNCGYKQEAEPTLTTLTKPTTTKLNDDTNDGDDADASMRTAVSCNSDYIYTGSETAITRKNLHSEYFNPSSTAKDVINNTSQKLGDSLNIKEEFVPNTTIMSNTNGYVDIGSDITAINGDFDPAEVTITMSATAIGTIIPGNDGLDVRKKDNILDASETTTSTKSTSQYKPNAVYLCNQCQYPCESLDELTEHHDKHSNPPMMVSPRSASDFECEICHCKYKSLALLKHHMKRHIARKYSCTQCPKTYINRTELMAHMQLHSGLMPHKCDMCEKQFNYRHHLKRHKDVAHFGKRHACPVDGCGRKFTTAAQLKIHMWNHNGNMPYKCKYCDRDFKKREPLRQHTRKSHNVILTEEDIAEIFRATCGYTNPHDFTVPDSSGKMLRRSDVEATTAASSCYMADLTQIAPTFNIEHENN